jgi:hypothetical protein
MISQYKGHEIIAFGYNYLVLKKQPDIFDNSDRFIVYPGKKEFSRLLYNETKSKD